MSEALKQAAAYDLIDRFLRNNLYDDDYAKYSDALEAISQPASSPQPATPEPVACANPDDLKSNWHAHHVIVNKAALQMVRNALRNDVERGLKVRGEMLAELDLATFQAHPAPSVPDGWVLMPRELTPDEAMRGQGALLDMYWDAPTCFVARYAELIRATEPRRAAIQQAEAQQPATGEPVAWIRRHPNGALSNELLTHVQVEQVRRDSGAWVPLYTQRRACLT